MPYLRWLHALAHPETKPLDAIAGAELAAGDRPPVEVLRPVAPGALSRSLAIRHVDAGSCGGPEAELSLLSSPVYDMSRFGFSFTASPRHADLLLVTGTLTEEMVPVVAETYSAMPAPRRVVACGACGDPAACPLASGRDAAADLRQVIPVDVFVRGCPPSPAALLAGLFAAAGRRVRGLDALMAEGD